MGIPTWNIQTNNMEYQELPSHVTSWQDWYNEGLWRTAQHMKVNYRMKYEQFYKKVEEINNGK